MLAAKITDMRAPVALARTFTLPGVSGRYRVLFIRNPLGGPMLPEDAERLVSSFEPGYRHAPVEAARIYASLHYKQDGMPTCLIAHRHLQPTDEELKFQRVWIWEDAAWHEHTLGHGTHVCDIGVLVLVRDTVR